MSKAQCLTGINRVDRMSDENLNSLLQRLRRKNTENKRRETFSFKMAKISSNGIIVCIIEKKACPT